MKLKNFEYTLNDGKEVVVEFNEREFNGRNIISIRSLGLLTIKEMHEVSAVLFVYLGSHARDIPLDLDYLVEIAHDLYHQVQDGRYEGLKRIEEMTAEDFNRVIGRLEVRLK